MAVPCRACMQVVCTTCPGQAVRSKQAHQQQVPVQVTVLVSTNCSSAGEALRLIDQKHLIKNDFVLVREECY
jgi:hypothetical protein